MTKEELMQAIEEMSVLELADLVKAMEEKFGVSAAAPVAVAAAGPAAAGAAAEEKSEFNVVLAEVGASKLKVIKGQRQRRRFQRRRGSFESTTRRSWRESRIEIIDLQKKRPCGDVFLLR